MIANEAAVFATIQKTKQAFASYYNQRDFDALVAIYAEEGQVLAPNLEVIHGREAIKEFWQGGVQMGIAETQLATREVESSGEMAFEVGEYIIRLADGSTLDQGKYMVVYKLQDQTWKMYREIWNSSLPAQS